jgi:hypothetical protein
MSAAYSEDGILYPWTVTGDAAELWNTYFSQKFGWRAFTKGKSGSSKKAAYRLSMILKRNARWLECSPKSDLDDLYAQWRTMMIGASAYLEKNGVNNAAVALDRQLEITMTFWRFQEPSLKHLHIMTYTALGVDPDGALAADEDRRKEKGQLLREFNDEVKRFTKKAAYVVGSGPYSNQRLEQALELARQALMRAEEDLEWSEG